MPIEIKELHIRVTVNVPSGNDSTGARRFDDAEKEEDKNAMVAECVEQVLQILRDKRER